MPVTLRVDASQTQGTLRPVWRYFGYDEPNYTYMQDGKKLLSELATLDAKTTVYVRTHNLLTTGDGTPALKWGSTNAYTEDAQGKPHYDWTLTDRIFDTYLQARVCGPTCRSGSCRKRSPRHPNPISITGRRDKAANCTPAGRIRPKTTRKWGELVYQWAQHCVERYGRTEASGGTGRYGTSRTSPTGTARPKSTKNSTTMP